MKVRLLLYLTAFVSAILGATVAYLALSVPNDLRADALMKTARQEITSGNHDKARESLAKVVQQYPRTDAAAAATVALSSLEKKERDDLARAVAQLRAQNEQQTKLIADLQKNVTTIRNTPPQVVTVQAPPPKPAPAKVSPKKKTTPKKKTATKRRRR
ncbi:MAG TPA: hypothetical protein VFP80_16680 [Thermoanaerobaculia bacterium]|nr:hypothetical protein [Thermoanaerobaculia bacterium]